MEIRQKSVINKLTSIANIEDMIPIWGSFKWENLTKCLFMCYLKPSDCETKMQGNSFPSSIELIPGCSQDGENKTTYYRWNNIEEFEPLIIERDFGGRYDSFCEVSEEFRLLFNLYFDAKKSAFIEPQKGDIVVRVDNNGNYYIRRKFLKSYLAVKKKSLCIYFDSQYGEFIVDNTKYDEEISGDFNNGNYTLSIDNKNNFSCLRGTIVIGGCPIEESGIWPYERQKEYIDFVVGIDENGEPIGQTCNPEKCTYIKSVFFKREVLDKYYKKSGIYSVEDGLLRYGTQWVMPIDNCDSTKDYISVFLGDLGRYLSTEEMHYWKSFNIPYGTMSDVAIKRELCAEFCDSNSPDFVFKNLYVKVNEEFLKRYGWPFFRLLKTDDTYNLNSLRIPDDDSQETFDMLVLMLVKVLIDSINEEKIMALLLNDYKEEKLRGSINKLELFFEEVNLSGHDSIIEILRNLQTLRSTGTGHRKGENYTKAGNKYDLIKKTFHTVFCDILNQANKFLTYILGNIEVFDIQKRKHIFLSIIIPFFNASGEIRRCLDSIWVQKIKTEYEVICVDDCSKDDSIAIIEDEMTKHANLRLFRNKTNRRAGGARNHGVQEANGEYVVFIDADDYFHPESLHKAVEHLKANPDLDFLVCNFARELPEQPNDQFVHTYATEEKLSIKEYIQKAHIPCAPWQWFFRRKLMTDNNIWFRENCISEDVDWTHRLVLVAKYIQYQPILLTHYTIGIGTQTALSYAKPANVYSYMRAGNELYKLCDAYDALGCGKYIRNLSRGYISQGLKYFLAMNDSVSNKVASIRTIIPKGISLAFPWNLARQLPHLYSFMTNILFPFAVFMLKKKAKHNFRGIRREADNV